MNSKSPDFKSLSFGAPAAERDIDRGLRDYFVESDTFRRVLAGEKFVILGNRGSGKSAIFKMVAERERAKGTVVIELAPENYSYEMLSSIMKHEAEGAWAKQGAYAAAWKYLIYVLVMKALNKQGRRLKTGSAAKIYEYLRDNHGGEQSNPISTLISYLKRMEGVKIGKYEAAIKSKELLRLYKLEEIEPLLPCIADVCRRQNVVVLSRLSWKWRKRSSVKIAERTYEKRAQAVHS